MGILDNKKESSYLRIKLITRPANKLFAFDCVAISNYANCLCAP